MASIYKDLLEAVKRHEAQGMTKNKAIFSELSALEIIVNDVHKSLRPSLQDYDSRRQLIRIFNGLARELYGDDTCPVVTAFGSFLMQMFNVTSDLDLSIDFTDEKVMVDRVLQVKTLRKFAKKFYVLKKKGIFTNIQIILSARVPVVKVTDRRTGVECDLSVGNLDGITKSQIVFMVSAIDERFGKLSIVLKAWAKAHDINSSKDGTLSSWSLILLAAFHLQTRDIPILPPFSAILKDGLDPVDVQKNIRQFQNYGKNNKESVSQLFVSLLVKLESVEEFWPHGLCASIYEGSWIHNKLGCMSIEDFMDRSQNACRSLKAKKMTKIYQTINLSLEQISLFSKGTVDAVKVKHLLFEGDPVETSKTGVDASLSTSKRKELRKRKRLVRHRAAEDKTKVKSDNPSNAEVPTPSACSSRAENNTPTSYRGTSQSQEIPRVTNQPRSVPSVPYPPSRPYRNIPFWPERTHYDAWSHSPTIRSSFHDLSIAAPHDFRPYSGPPIRDVGEYIHEDIGPETLGYASYDETHFPPAPFPNPMGCEMPYDHHPPPHHLAPPFTHSEVFWDSHAYDDREMPMHRFYPPLGHPPFMPFPRY